MSSLKTKLPEHGKCLKIAQWGLLVVSWWLILNLLARGAAYAYDQAFLQLGPARIVGTSAVIYQEAPAYIYTNPMAMVKLTLKLKAIDYGITLLAAALATGLLGLLFRLRGFWAKCLLILFGVIMFLSLIYLAIICVWEWGLAWFALLLCARYFPRWIIKSRFTAMALITALALLGWHRMNLKDVERQYEAFWNKADACDTLEKFTEWVGEPLLTRRHISEEDKKWFDNLAHIDASLWLPGKNLFGFVSPNMSDILLLPWFDDDGKRIAFAWCDLTPERRQFLQGY